jgi:hypothetical protein
LLTEQGELLGWIAIANLARNVDDRCNSLALLVDDALGLLGPIERRRRLSRHRLKWHDRQDPHHRFVAPRQHASGVESKFALR